MSSTTADPLWGAMNHRAFMGCTPLYHIDGATGTTAFDYSSLFWYAGIMWSFYGVIIFLSPFGLLPIEGMYKYMWMRFEGGMKDGVEGRGDYSNPFVATMIRFAGIGMVTVGLFHIWAAGDHPDFDFFTVMTFFAGCQFIVFLIDILRGPYKLKMAAGWGLNFAAILALSIAVLASQPGDDKQLSKEKANDGFNAGGALFYFAVFATAGSINIWMISYEKFGWMGPNLYLNEENQLEYNDFVSAIMRLNAMPTTMIAVYLWWAALNFEVSEHNYGQDFPFLMAVWLSYIPFFIWCITCFVAQPDSWEPFAIFQAPLLCGTLFAVFVATWHSSCYGVSNDL